MENTILDNLPPKADAWENHLASLIKRFFNRLIDFIAVIVLLLIVNIVLQGALTEAMDRSKINEYLITGLAFFIYYTLLESLTGRTLGKLVTGTKVISLTGSPLNVGRVALRSLCRFIPFNAFSFFSGERGWHDTISKTAVVSRRFQGSFADDE